MEPRELHVSGCMKGVHTPFGDVIGSQLYPTDRNATGVVLEGEEEAKLYI